MILKAPTGGIIHDWKMEEDAFKQKRYTLSFSTSFGMLQAIWCGVAQHTRHTIFSVSLEEEKGRITLQVDRELFGEITDHIPSDAESALSISLKTLQDAYGEIAIKRKLAIGRCIYRLKHHPDVQDTLSSFRIDMTHLFEKMSFISFDNMGQIQLMIEKKSIPLLPGVDFRPFIGRMHVIRRRNNAASPIARGILQPIKPNTTTAHAMMEEFHEDMQTFEEGNISIDPWMPFMLQELQKK